MRPARGLDGVVHACADGQSLQPGTTHLPHDVHDDDAGCLAPPAPIAPGTPPTPGPGETVPVAVAGRPPGATPTGAAPALTPVGPAREPPPGAMTVPSPSDLAHATRSPNTATASTVTTTTPSTAAASGSPPRPDERAR